MHHFIEKAQAALHADIPQEFDLDTPALVGDDWPMTGIVFRQAAVLVAVIDQPNPSVILTRRPMHMNKHAGQIALPGGKLESFDLDAKHAALREAHEEIGLESKFVDILGCLDVYQIGSGFKICPVVGVVKNGYSLQADPNEVDEIFELPLDFLMTDNNYKIITKHFAGRARQCYILEYEDYKIWGATAGMLKNLFDRLKG